MGRYGKVLVTVLSLSGVPLCLFMIWTFSSYSISLSVAEIPLASTTMQLRKNTSRPMELSVTLDSFSQKPDAPACPMPQSPMSNPGCEAKTLHAYKAVDSGKHYNHPSLVHYVKLGSGMQNFNFREYTSVLSVYKFLQPKKIMFHTYTGFTGTYWDKIQEMKNVEMKVNRIDKIDTIGGKHVFWIQHVADYVKLSNIYKYGGTALDFDVIIINGTRLKHEQSLSECVLAQEQDFINGGFYSCVPNTTFVAKWLESYHKDYIPHLWLHNISYRPMNLLTDKDCKECYNMHVDETICFFPSWNVSKQWLEVGKVKWRTKTAAHYFVKNGIPNDGEGLLKEKFPLAELLQYVHNV